MANGLLAALSPNEDATLHRIASGGAHPKGLRESDLTRLKRLGLVEESRVGLSLSLLGQRRLGRTPPPATTGGHFLPPR